MGLVKEINDLDLVISLPNQQTGFVSITDISDYITAQVEAAAGDMENDDDEENTTGAADKDDQETEVPNLSDFFTVGQLLTCAISALQTGSPSAPSSNSNNGKNSNNNAAAPSSSTKRRIELSLKPEHVNAALSVTDLYSGMPLVGSVVSKEDHGYIINLGITDTSGFLKASSSSMDLKLGQLVGVVVKDTPKSTTQRTIHLTFTSLTPSTPLQLPPTASITSIQPGQLLPAKIKSVLAHGLVLGLQDGLIEGTVHVFHTDIVGQLHSGKTMDDFFRVGDRIKAARVVHVDSAKKRIGLSLRQSVLPTDNENDDVSLADTTASSFPSSWNLRVGDGKEVDVGSRLTLKVVEADSDKGLVLVDESGDLVAFAHVK